MKKTVSLILALGLVLSLALTLVACGGRLSGTYTTTDSLGGGSSYTESYEFSGKHVVKRFTLHMTGSDITTVYEGTYVVSEDDGERTITLDLYLDGVKDETQSIKVKFTAETDGSRINIGGTWYDKK